WKGSSTPLAGSWPGTKVTTKNAEGYYELNLHSTDVYNLVLNNGSGKQTNDITGLQGGTWIRLNNDMSYSIIKTGDVNVTASPVVTPPSQAATTKPVVGKNTFTFYVSSHTGQAPYLYIWDDEKTYSAAFPGTLLSVKEDGYYVMTVKSDSSALNCIASYGNSQTQSGNITGVTGTVTIENDGADYKSCTVTKSVAVESNYKKLKSMTRSIKNMAPEDFTASTWNTLYSYVAPADAIIALGEENANEDAINAMLANEMAAMTNLQVAAPVVNKVVSGATTITGTAAYGSNITVTVNGTTYTTVADDVTGEWSVKVNSMPFGSQVLVESALGCYLSNSTLFRI
ncbi:MAG: starch-binding protein, partial [Clostridium sp.]|nr:starch-binding protein [Clostridium sp.]